MEQGKFEEIIADKFDGEGIKPSNQVWTNIEGDLNKTLVSYYTHKTKVYQFVAAAAILLAFSIVFVWATLNDNGYQNKSESAFNALSNGTFGEIDPFRSNLSIHYVPSPTFVITDSEVKSEKSPVIHKTDTDTLLKTNYVFLDGILPNKELADIDFVPTLFRKPGFSISSNAKTLKNKPKLWAGVSAEAGSFTPGYSGNQNITSGVSASAVSSVLNQQLNNPTTSAVQNDLTSGSSRSVGMDIGLKLGKNWALESGIAYTAMEADAIANLSVVDVFLAVDDNSNKQFSANNGNVANFTEVPEFITSELIDDEVELNSSFQMASVPLKAGYFIVDNIFSLRLNAGFAANYLVETSLTDDSNGLINFDNSQSYNDWYFDGIGGVEFGYSFFDKLDFTLEPNYRQSITPISTNLTLQSGFSIKTGLRYRISK